MTGYDTIGNPAATCQASLAGYSYNVVMAHAFQLVGGHVALDFANTLDYRFAPDRTVDFLATYDDLLEFALQSRMVRPSQARKLAQSPKAVARRALKDAIELREVLDPLFRSVVLKERPSEKSLQTFNRFLAETRDHECLGWKDFEFIRRYGDPSEHPHSPIWLLVDAALELLTSPNRVNMRECQEPSCRWLFLDQSKNHSRRWCDMQLCGNRTKIRRFRERWS
jgi:predicted RNA-binding Zn ribbon-like protein